MAAADDDSDTTVHPVHLRGHVLTRWLLVLAVLAVADTNAAATHRNRQKQVLVLYATRRDAQIAVVGDRELPQTLRNGLPDGVDYYSEFIDYARSSRANYEAAFRDFLRWKYRRHAFDLVIAMGDTPLAFIGANRRELFSDAPVVFFATVPPRQRLANSTGMIVGLNLAGTLGLATALQPDLRQVFVVSGADVSDIWYENRARAQFAPFASRLSFEYLSGLPTKELDGRLGTLPDHSMVYYLVVDRDGINQNYHPLEYLDHVTAVARAPIYSWVDSAMDHGIVGGSLKDQSAQARAVGELALRVLHGEHADSIPISQPDLNVMQVDWRQLRRWRLREDRVPATVVVRFREASVWDRYWMQIVAALTALLAQTTLIAALLVQRARRQQAEERLRGNQAALWASYERIRELGARLLNAQETERSRIARELHDDIGQQIALLAINLELFCRSVSDRGACFAADLMSRIDVIARTVHDLSHRLHPTKLGLIGLVASLRALLRELAGSDTAITFDDVNVPSMLPPTLSLCLFRITQEALQNALRYSGAEIVSVHLRGDSNRLTLSIVDDGVGFDMETVRGRGLGLVSMRERVEALGGTFEIRSEPGAGTRVDVSVPVQPEYSSVG